MSVRLYSIFNKVFKVGSLFRGCGFSKIITKQGVKIHIISGSNEGQMLSKNLIESMRVKHIQLKLIESNESETHLNKES